jgi:hypothetical protein
VSFFEPIIFEIKFELTVFKTKALRLNFQAIHFQHSSLPYSILITFPNNN